MLLPLTIVYCLFEMGFKKHTKLYPKNDLSEYKYHPKASLLGFVSEGNFIINIYEHEKVYGL